MDSRTIAPSVDPHTTHAPLSSSTLAGPSALGQRHALPPSPKAGGGMRSETTTFKNTFCSSSSVSPCPCCRARTRTRRALATKPSARGQTRAFPSGMVPPPTTASLVASASCSSCRRYASCCALALGSRRAARYSRRSRCPSGDSSRARWRAASFGCMYVCGWGCG